jgi:hypothetical protein
MKSWACVVVGLLGLILVLNSALTGADEKADKTRNPFGVPDVPAPRRQGRQGARRQGEAGRRRQGRQRRAVGEGGDRRQGRRARRRVQAALRSHRYSAFADVDGNGRVKPADERAVTRRVRRSRAGKGLLNRKRWAIGRVI